MPDQNVVPGFSAEPPPFDDHTASATMADAVIAMVTMSIRSPGTKPDPEQAVTVMGKIREALTTGLAACAEVSRLRTGLAALRDEHRPRPHADPTQPGALCAACSVHGALVSWPCGTWSTAERILNHGKA
ncbi:hypothetical protein ABZU94_10595 [Streptomyces mirabilis]|uniref:hypothetical protein n=1 Tax=Streptomyces sp. NPDC005388 TaxID=3156717 RepID=UPI00339E46CB